MNINYLMEEKEKDIKYLETKIIIKSNNSSFEIDIKIIKKKYNNIK